MMISRIDPLHRLLRALVLFSAFVVICWSLLSSLELSNNSIIIIGGVQAFTSTTTTTIINHHHHHHTHPKSLRIIAKTTTTQSSIFLSEKFKLYGPIIKRRRTRNSSVLLFSNNNNDNDNDNNNNNNDFEWILRRFERAEKTEIVRDAILVSCFVLLRFFIYDITTGTKVVPGWDIQDIIWLTGTFSSATVLIFYWTVAGLLSRSFEIINYNPIQVFVNVALCCPIWLATEHLLEFGPTDIGGPTLTDAIGTGFVTLATFMIIARNVTAGWRQ